MNSLNPSKITNLLIMAIILLLSACGGGGGSGESGSNNSGFTAAASTNTNKPQTSSMTAESSSQQSISEATNNSAENPVSYSQISQAVSSQINTSSAPKASANSSSSSLSLSSNSNTSSKSSTPKATIDIAAPSMIPTINVDFTKYDLAVISWTAASDNVGVTAYKIYRNQIQIDEIAATDLVYADFNVTPSSSYTYGVSAGDAVGNWSPVKTILAKTQAQPVPPIPAISSSAGSSIYSSAKSSNSNISSPSTSSLANSSTNSLANSSAMSSSSSSIRSSDLIPPSAPSSISQLIATATRVDISWAAATDNIGVIAYRIYRNNILLNTISATSLEYSDKTTAPSTSYTYSVESGDAAGNWSLTRKTIAISTPSAMPLGDITLYWAPPNKREDESSITEADLGGFLIKYKSKTDSNYTFIDINDGSAKSHIISNISIDFDIQIATYDLNNLYSAFVPISPK